MKRPSIPLLLGLALTACAPLHETRALQGVAIPALDTTPRQARASREEPPPSGRDRAFHLLKPTWSTLPSGLAFAVAESHALPIVELRVVVLGGRSAEGDRPGVAALTAELLKGGGAGRESAKALLARVESLGTQLAVDVDDDRITLRMSVTSDLLDEALDLLGLIVSTPRMGAPEFARIHAHLVEGSADAAVEDGEYGASLMLRRGLFSLPGARHPYSLGDTLRADLARLTLADCRAFHRRSFVPGNTFLLLAGDTSIEAGRVAVARAFGRYRGDAPPARVIPPALPARERRITVVHRPGSEQSEIYVGTLGPPRNDPGWAAFTVMNRLLGGKGAGRLFMDVREKLSLAYETSSTIDELASGPTAFYAYSTTRTPKTGLAVQALLGHLARVAGEPATEEEIATAKRFLQLAFATRMSTLGAVAGELVALHTLGLPDDDHEGYRRALEAVTPAMVAEVAHRHLGGEHEIIAVAGDADLIAPMLSHFGAVEVVDPAGDFAPIRTIPRAPDAALEPKEHE